MSGGEGFLLAEAAEEARLQRLVAANLAVVRERIARAGGAPDLRIVAVTKTFPASAALAALRAGVRELGENYADELLKKAAALERLAPGEGRWHFLGALQRNKIGRLADVVACYESVDRLAEGEAIARRRPGAEVLVEVDTTGDPARGGVPAAEVESLVGALSRLDLRVEGLMTVAPPDPAAATACFSLVGQLRRELGLSEASMGMSEDLELAVEAGSTMIRVGRALFGPREASKSVSQ